MKRLNTEKLFKCEYFKLASQIYIEPGVVELRRLIEGSTKKINNVLLTQNVRARI